MKNYFLFLFLFCSASFAGPIGGPITKRGVGLIGTYKVLGAANCDYSGTSASFASFAADNDCAAPTVTGILVAPATEIPAFKISSLSSGTYLIFATFSNLSGTSTTCGFRLYDGTNSSNEHGVPAGSMGTTMTIVWPITYAAAQTNLQVEIQYVRSGGANSCGIRNTLDSYSIGFSVIRLL